MRSGGIYFIGVNTHQSFDFVCIHLFSNKLWPAITRVLGNAMVSRDAFVYFNHHVTYFIVTLASTFLNILIKLL